MSAYFNTFETQQEFLNFKNSEDFLINSVNYVKENNSLSYGAVSKTQYNGHVDVEGLREIGWTDDDIAYYQTYGVNWNEKDDMYHKVSEDNKALYGVLTAENIQDYKDRIVYLPKIDTSNVTDMDNMFINCYSLVTIPQLDASNVFVMNGMFNNCYSLVTIPQLDTSNVTLMPGMFANCYSLVSVPQLDTSNVTLMASMFANCYSLVTIPQLDASNVTAMTAMFNICYSLTHIKIKNLRIPMQIPTGLLNKESLLYIINNETATSEIVIQLHPYVYEKLSNDTEIIAALDNHPNILLGV